MSALASPSHSINRPGQSCIRCFDRKVKCDRQKPCSACTKHKSRCVYRPLQPVGSKRRRGSDNDQNIRQKRQVALRGGQDLGLNNSNGTPNDEPHGNLNPTVMESDLLPTPASTTADSTRSITKTQLLHGEGRSKFVDNGLWSRVVEEFHNPEEALEESSYEEDDTEPSDNEFDYVLGTTDSSSAAPPHPSPERVLQLWQIFVDNVDPLTKVVHVPTLRPAIHKAVTNLESIPRSLEALMLAIYSAAVMSLKDGECRQRFGQSQKQLLSHYTSATKGALSRSKFMGTSSIVVLQALVIHLLSVRDIYQPRTVWTLTGVALRIAEGMGLHRDGSILGLPPYEIEIRRRVWWVLKLHDFRAAELSGLAKFPRLDMNDDTPKPPANINDHELYPSMSSSPIISDRATDMMFSVFRVELLAGNVAKFRTLWSDSGVPEGGAADAVIDSIKDMLESTYLRHCDPAKPLHLLTMLHARSALNVGRFMVHHPRRWTSTSQISDSERHYVWTISINLLEQYDMMQSNPTVTCFAWHASYFLPWHAFIHVLDTLRASPLMHDASKVWRLVDATYENNPDMVANTKKLIHVAVGNLCLKAYSARESALAERGETIPEPPTCITALRTLREVAKAGIHKPRTPRSKQTQTEVNANGANPQRRNSLHGIPSPQGPLQQENSQALNDEAGWYTSNMEYDFVGTFNGTSNADLDFMMMDDFSAENAVDEPIDWSQWDAWLGNQN